MKSETAEGKMERSDFVHLHLHTEYSLLDGEEDRSEDEQNDFDALELCAEFARVLLENTLEYIVLSQIALNGDICAVADNLGLSTSEVRKVAKRAYNAVEKARE
jgi:hypothetical protein